uniref:Uncharacterized protein n=1 Tax=Knipowitschia caucasica TaxID=637954 RepID=A0AAV2M4C1_KNICA
MCFRFLLYVCPSDWIKYDLGSTHISLTIPSFIQKLFAHFLRIEHFGSKQLFGHWKSGACLPRHKSLCWRSKFRVSSKLISKGKERMHCRREIV